jgi:hypothetical protein
LSLSRLDLDGAGSPEALVTRILKLEPGLTLPVPIEDVCSALDIVSIADLETEGFEAALITDELKSQGAILVAKGRSRQRRRFSIAHELGHFLIPAHMPPPDGQFLCSADQLRLLAQRDQDRRARMEVEANRFAALLLMPPPLLRARLREKRQPQLEKLVALAETFDVSKDAMARAFAEHHDEPVAVLIWRNGRLARCYRSATMPWLSVRIGDYATREQRGGLSAVAVGPITAPSELDPHHWFDERSARQVLALTEQRMPQREEFVMQMLHAELRDEDEPGDRDPDERWRPRF